MNDDLASTDGFSESVVNLSGRPQLQPTVTVDQATGTVVVAYLDARYDAARVRVANMVTTSIDGGSTFAASTFANAPQTAFDVVTQQNVVLGPIPDNQSAGNPARETQFGFGSHQAVAAYGGKVYPAWSSNENGGPRSGGNNNANVYKLDIRVAQMTTAGGPRVISSTMGQVTATNTNAGSFNNTFTADGRQIVDGFTVTFDRLVDPNTFDASDVQVKYLTPYAASSTAYVDVPVISVTALNSNTVGTTQFLVRFQGRFSAGTYSYSVGPNISDRIRRVNGLNRTAGNPMDQNADGVEGQPSLDMYATPRPLNGVPFLLPYDTATLPIIVPGPHVVSTSVPGVTPTSDNLVLNGVVSALDVSFDRDMQIGTFTGADVLSLIGPAGPVAGPFNVMALDARTFRVSFTPQALSGTYSMVLGPDILDLQGLPIDKDLNAGLDRLRSTGSTGLRATVTTNSADTPQADRRPARVDHHLVPDGHGQLLDPGIECPAQHHVPQRPRPDRDPDRSRRAPDPVVLGRGRGRRSRPAAEFHQHGPRRPGGHPDPERPGAVLRPVQAAAATLGPPGHRVGRDLFARDRQRLRFRGGRAE